MSACIELIAVIAVLQFFFFGFQVGNARGAAGIKAPAMTGDEGLERMIRVQMNTLELLIMFFPALFLASKYGPTWLVCLLGLTYIVGRFVYWRAYVSDPGKRGTGFMMSVAPIMILLLVALFGIFKSMFGG
jgi:uncharacterized membrane protein YecN with MAPEG domain